MSATAYVLIPSEASSYVYDWNDVVGEITGPQDRSSFIWFDKSVDTRRYPTWLALSVRAETASAANRLADAQATRVGTGLYPFYLKEAQ